MPGVMDRRRFITISAAVAGLALSPRGVFSKAAEQVVEWRGTALGALASIRIHHTDHAEAERLIRHVVAETRRLEAMFSLYRPDSSLSALNHAGLLVAPPAELVDLLTSCDDFWRITDRKFDPTVQPLWQCYADHFASAGMDGEGPHETTLKQTLELVGWDKVRFDRDSIVFVQPGMGITLNGVAQGYIADRVIELLRAAGIDNCLVDMGEIRCRGLDGHRPWQVAIESGRNKSDRFISLLNNAIATSGAWGFQFDEQGRYNHLFDPSTGTCASPARTVTVVGDTAATVDALSTAFALMNEKHIEAVLPRAARVEVYVTTADGTRMIGETS